jgi:hypothetical protein
MLIGAKGGANLATVGISADGSGVSTATRQAFHGAVMLGFGLKPNIAIEVPMTYVGKGFTSDSSGTNGVLSDLSIDYFEFPVLLVGTFPAEPSMFAARVFAGPAFGLRSRCSLVAANQDPTGWTDCDADISSAVDFSIMAGAGVKIGKGRSGFTVELSYDYGLSNIVKENTSTSAKNRNLMLSVGYIVSII